MSPRTLFLAAALLLPLAALAARAEESAPAAQVEKSTAAVYTYQGDRFRDPFIPLAGQGFAEMPTRTSGEDEEFNPTAVELKGILKSRNGRWAVLRSQGGTTYVVKEGKILDAKRQPVKGYVGIIKDKSLVLIGPNNQVNEFKIQGDETKKKS